MIDPKNLSKEALRKEFAKENAKYYGTKLFEEQGFKRHTCRICGMNFWSIPDRDACEDPSHAKRAFFKDKPLVVDYAEFWKKFADFFKKNGHAEIARYPVVSRWRQDLYFTIASILDFQRIENGRMSFEYGANPLVVPQMCLRFGDIENVGVTGGHFTCFMMAGQHAFNWPKDGYWRDKTIELNFRYLTEVLGVKKEALVYNEDVWAMGDFSEFGPSLEVFSSGAELGNSVFTQFEYAEGQVRELEGKVVDVGWGFERLLWFYTGADNAYEAVFHNVLGKIRKKIGFELDSALYKRFAPVSGELNVDEIKNVKEREKEILKSAGISLDDYDKKIRPAQAVYAILDHTRTLLFAISDGALPSNIGGGYNLRIILRRSLDFIEKYKLGIDLNEIARLEAEDLKPIFPELAQNLDVFAKVVDVEVARYKKSNENARRTIESMLAKSNDIDAKHLRTLYESNGITPQFILNVAAEKGVKVELPDNAFASIVTGDYAKKEKQKKVELELPKNIKPTKQLYYEFKENAEAEVLMAKGKYLVLDKTPFYPEGGGQDPDGGTINGMTVADVQRLGDVVVHVMEQDIEGKKEFKPGATVACSIDLDRRRRLIAHHTATHLISAAARKLLGKHAWQEGARKYVDRAHIDVVHWDKLTKEELNAIEDLVNSEIVAGVRVRAREMERGEAESKYGFAIYQGHGVPAKKMRIITIETLDGKLIDAEACGGLHAVERESALGLVKIIDSFRPHDGIVRIEFVAGLAALDYFRKEHDELGKVAEGLNAERFKSAEKLQSVQADSKELFKRLESYKELIASSIASTLPKGETIEKEIDAPREILRKIAGNLTDKETKSVVLLTNKNGDVVCVAGDRASKGAIDLVKAKFGSKFKGGGSKKVAEGKIAQ